jgi:hypothetical protein
VAPQTFGDIAVPVFYFDIEDANGIVPDELGMSVRGSREAVVEALTTLGEMIRDVAASGTLNFVCIHVSDSGRNPLFRATTRIEWT